MKYKSDFGHIEFIAETEEDKSVLLDLFKLIESDDSIFGKKVVELQNDETILYIITYV